MACSDGVMETTDKSVLCRYIRPSIDRFLARLNPEYDRKVPEFEFHYDSPVYGPGGAGGLHWLSMPTDSRPLISIVSLPPSQVTKTLNRKTCIAGTTIERPDEFVMERIE